MNDDLRGELVVVIVLLALGGALIWWAFEGIYGFVKRWRAQGKVKPAHVPVEVRLVFFEIYAPSCSIHALDTAGRLWVRSAVGHWTRIEGPTE